MTITTAYGTITEKNSDFGYGFITIEDGYIVYRDSFEWKTWKTVAGFERWTAKQNKICGGVYDKVCTIY